MTLQSVEVGATTIALDDAQQPDASRSGGNGNRAGLHGLLLLAGGQKLLLGLAMLASAAAVGLQLVPYLCVARMAPLVLQPTIATHALREIALWACAAIAVRYVLVAASGALAHVAAFKLLLELRLRITEKLSRVPLSFYLRYSTGDLKRRVMDDVQDLEVFVAHHLTEGVAAVSVPLVTAVLLFVVDWRMALASIAVAPVAVAAIAFAMRDVESMHGEWYARQDRTNQMVLEYLRAIHVVKTFGISARSAGELSRSVSENSRWIARLMHKNGNAFAIFQTLVTSSWITIVPLGGYFYLQGSLSAERLLLFLILGPQILGSSARVGYAAETLKKLTQGYGRVVELLSVPIVEGSGSAQAQREGGVSFRNVSLAYEPGKLALNNVSFEAAPGTLTAIVGESGAGKSSITRLVARFWEPSSGTVHLGGVNVRELPPEQLIAQLSFAFQDVFLFEGTVASNLRLAKPDATDAELERVCRQAGAHDFILRLPRGYQSEVGERGARLSGGEQQRLTLARSLLKDAPILILDEATSATDALTEASILKALDSARRDRTVLMIAHRLATVAHADQILVLSLGSIVERGSHAELLAQNGVYARLWKQQMLARDWELRTQDTQKVVAS